MGYMRRRYEIRERHHDVLPWTVIAWFNELPRAKAYWRDMTRGHGVECILVRIEYTEEMVHYTSADNGADL